MYYGHIWLDMLFGLANIPEYQFRLQWRPNTIAFWDNRATQHQAIRDVYDSDCDREFYRVTLHGAIPVGVDGVPSKHLAGEQIKPL